jgi:hypothetical protein
VRIPPQVWVAPTVATILAIPQACGGGKSDVGPVGAGSDASIDAAGDGTNGAETNCTAQGACVHECPAGGSTTISGVVLDPAGKNPLDNVVVYVPRQAPGPLPIGASCASCSPASTGGAVAYAFTDADGRFSIARAPDGSDIPLVVQAGKWRRQAVVSTVVACQDNAQPAASLRLPRSRQEGDIPNIAVSTGAADSLECLFRRIGVDASEYGSGGAGPGRIHIFQGGTDRDGGAFSDEAGSHAGGMTTDGGSPPSTAVLWDSASDLSPYDLVVLSCEGTETANPNPQALFDYINLGGTVFASHDHYAWFLADPFASLGLATWTPGDNAITDMGSRLVPGQVVTEQSQEASRAPAGSIIGLPASARSLTRARSC